MKGGDGDAQKHNGEGTYCILLPPARLGESKLEGIGAQFSLARSKSWRCRENWVYYLKVSIRLMVIKLKVVGQNLFDIDLQNRGEKQRKKLLRIVREADLGIQ